MMYIYIWSICYSNLAVKVQHKYVFRYCWVEYLGFETKLSPRPERSSIVASKECTISLPMRWSSAKKEVSFLSVDLVQAKIVP